MDDLSKIRKHVDSEGAECTCGSESAHRMLEYKVDLSYKQDDARAKMRQERNTFALRAAVLAQSNGYHSMPVGGLNEQK